MPKTPSVQAQAETNLKAPLDEGLISVAIIAKGPIAGVERAVEVAAIFLESRFEFFELAILVTASDYAQNAPIYDKFLRRRNVRCLILQDGTGEYRSAVLAATETIGDIVLIVHADEASALDLGNMYDTAVTMGGSVLLRHLRRAGLMADFGGRVLSAISGYDVDPRLLRSAAHPRAHISRMAARSDREIALRFMPRGARRPSELTVLELDESRVLSRKLPIFRRIGQAMEVLANAPPHLLRLLAAASFVVTLGALLYFTYSVTMWFAFGAELEPGWLTTSLAISGSTAFISLALGGISMALYQALNLLRDDTGDEILREFNNTDLFQEFHRVNVETMNTD